MAASRTSQQQAAADIASHILEMECSNCKRNFAWHLHGRDGCHYHSGFLQPMASTSDDMMDTEPTMEDFLQSRRWSCCQQAGNNPGCNWGRHQLRQPRSLEPTTGVRTGGNAFHSARGMKRRSSDDSDSDSSSGSGAESSIGSRNMVTGSGVKMRRLDRRDGMGAATLRDGRQEGTLSFFAGAHSG
ncbi:hypothetical protein HYQ45_006056 [Verticillium longisporum]|uniref:C2H2-type domain-containing protein n=1 Tax=Verticillium longisporum TaxID=100787 RepID=A0A8I3ARJ0_VERLO|nr:hypothetical protein HYQ45_006056 [Verticillium longisporum]